MRFLSALFVISCASLPSLGSANGAGCWDCGVDFLSESLLRASGGGGCGLVSLVAAKTGGGCAGCDLETPEIMAALLAHGGVVPGDSKKVFDLEPKNAFTGGCGGCNLEGYTVAGEGSGIGISVG